jgi:hypothetical protein
MKQYIFTIRERNHDQIEIRKMVGNVKVDQWTSRAKEIQALTAHQGRKD